MEFTGHAVLMSENSVNSIEKSDLTTEITSVCQYLTGSRNDRCTAGIIIKKHYRIILFILQLPFIMYSRKMADILNSDVVGHGYICSFYFRESRSNEGMTEAPTTKVPATKAPVTKAPDYKSPR